MAARPRTGWRLLAAVLPMAAASCVHERVAGLLEAAYTVSVADGNQQSAPAGSALPKALAVKVVDGSRVPVKGVRVIFRVQRGLGWGSRMLDSVGVTTPDGVATGELQLGSAVDSTVVVALIAAAPNRTATLVARAVAAPVVVSVSPSSFAGGDTVAVRGTGLAVAAGGGVEFGTVHAAPLGGITDTLVRTIAPACLTGGTVAVGISGAVARSNTVAATYQARTRDLAIPQYSRVTVQSAQLADCLTIAGGGSYLVVPQLASIGTTTDRIDWLLGSTGATELAAAPAAVVAGDNPIRREFEEYLRSNERAIASQARSEAAAARTGVVYREGAVAPPAVGSARAFKVVAALDGSSFTDVTARLKFAGEHVLLYVDTTGQGFTDEQYVKLASHFDRELYPIDIAAFGSESDVDGDGRILVLFTPKVNVLVKSSDCGQKGFVTGFFYGNDLLLQNPNSNKAEIFYSFVPDPGAKYSCAHTEDYVLRTLPGTFLHELQHMISFNQHVLARFGDPEVTWLGEGLAHAAEELGSKYYEARFPAPSGRSTVDQIFPDSAGPFITPQLLNAYLYFNNTLGHSVTTYGGAGSIEERGASWLFLRWLAEQKGDGILGRLVQTSKTGIANLEEKAGEPFQALFADFSVALYADSLPGVPRRLVPTRFQFGMARNLRHMMSRIAIVSGFSNPWPLPLYYLRPGGILQGSMEQGTMLHAILNPASTSAPQALRFSKPDRTLFTGSEGAQVSIFRLSP